MKKNNRLGKQFNQESIIGNNQIENMKTQYTKRDISTINKAFYNKVEEYSKLSLEELKELYPTLGGTYRVACLEVTNQKLIAQRNENLNEAIEDTKSSIVEQSNTETNDQV